jgi:hypothetical protein
MPESPHLPLDRVLPLDHHLSQACAWLDLSDSGNHSVPLSYAAFEFRLAIERLTFELLFFIRSQQLDADDKKSMKSFKNMEKRIHEFAGHQQQMDITINFINIVFNEAGSSINIAKIALGTLHTHWSECSDLCHFTWNLLVCGPDVAIRGEAYKQLTVIRDFLKTNLSSIVTWPRIHEPWFADLQNSYVRGEATEEVVRSHLRQTGVRIAVLSPDGTRTFLCGNDL